MALQRFDDALQQLFEQARVALDGAPRTLILDPLIDARTGAQTRATAALGLRALRRAAEVYPELRPRPLTARNLSAAPLLLIGTLNPAIAGTAGAAGSASTPDAAVRLAETATNPAGAGVADLGANANANANEEADDFRLLLALVDVGTGRSVTGTLAEASGRGLDTAPLNYFRDSPTWHRDRVTDAYVRSVRSGLRPGEPVDPLYLLRLPSAAFAHEGVVAYDAGRYSEALAAFEQMNEVAEYGDLRLLNGLYLTNIRAGRLAQARASIVRIVETGLDRRQLPLRVTVPAQGAEAMRQRIWLQEAARAAVRKQACLVVAQPQATSEASGVVGNAAAAATAIATAVRAQLLVAAPALKGRIDAGRTLPPDATAVAVPVNPARPGVELRVVDCI